MRKVEQNLKIVKKSSILRKNRSTKFLKQFFEKLSGAFVAPVEIFRSRTFARLSEAQNLVAQAKNCLWRWKMLKIPSDFSIFPQAFPRVSASFPELKMRFLDSSRTVDSPRAKKLLVTPSSFDFRSISMKLPRNEKSGIFRKPNCTVSRPGKFRVFRFWEASGKCF